MVRQLVFRKKGYLALIATTPTTLSLNVDQLYAGRFSSPSSFGPKGFVRASKGKFAQSLTAPIRRSANSSMRSSSLILQLFDPRAPRGGFGFSYFFAKILQIEIATG
jgi:hypothetical protein